MIALGILVFSVAAAAMFAVGDYSVPVKALYVGLAAGAAALQFVPALREQVHFLVPLFMQLFVCGSWAVANQME